MVLQGGKVVGSVSKKTAFVRSLIARPNADGSLLFWGERASSGTVPAAEVGPGRPSDAWFIAFAPVEAPRYAVACVVEHGERPATSIELARAYNNWIYETYLSKSRRFRAMGLIPLQEPKEAVAELRRIVREAGLLEGTNLYDVENTQVVHHLNQALKANVMFKKDIDYIVKDGKVVIIDEFTGRMMDGRRWSDGLHQAVEAKEGVPIQRENQTLASITFQNYFRMYAKLAGMTGTADTEAFEFQQIYHLETVVIPTHMTMVRKDLLESTGAWSEWTICEDAELGLRLGAGQRALEPRRDRPEAVVVCEERDDVGRRRLVAGVDPVVAADAAAAEGHHRKRPWESRLWQSQNPWPSYCKTRMDVPRRVRKINR